MSTVQNTPDKFTPPEDIENWAALYKARKLQGKTLSNIGKLASGSKIKVDQFVLFRTLWPPLQDKDQFKDASGIQSEHWVAAGNVMAASSSLGKFLQLVNGTGSLVDMNELDSEWPGPFASRGDRVLGNWDHWWTIKSLLAPHPSTDLDVHTTTLDETIVNVHLVLLIQELSNLTRSSKLECTITRVRYTPVFGTNSYTAVVDGVIRSRRTGKVLSILEVKPGSRFADATPVQMQETAEAVGWLRNQSGNVPELGAKSRLVIYQGFREVYLTRMTPGTRYVEYLERTTPTETTKPEEFMTMQSFGPWRIDKETELRRLCQALLAFLSAAEVAA